MSLYDTLTTINSTTFLLLVALLFATWLKPLNVKGISILRIALGLAIAYFLLVGWRTLDSVNNKYKNKQVSFKNNSFTQICNLKQLYKLYGSKVTSRTFSQKFDCEIINNENMYHWPKEDTQFMKIGKVGIIDSKQLFEIIDLVETNSYGLGASFGANGVLFYILTSNKHTYIINKSDLETGGKIK